MSLFGTLKGAPLKEAFVCTRICEQGDIDAKRYDCHNRGIGALADKPVNYFSTGNLSYCKEYKGGDNSGVQGVEDNAETCEKKHPYPTDSSGMVSKEDELAINNKRAACAMRLFHGDDLNSSVKTLTPEQKKAIHDSIAAAFDDGVTAAKDSSVTKKALADSARVSELEGELSMVTQDMNKYKELATGFEKYMDPLLTRYNAVVAQNQELRSQIVTSKSSQ